MHLQEFNRLDQRWYTSGCLILTKDGHAHSPQGALRMRSQVDFSGRLAPKLFPKRSGRNPTGRAPRGDSQLLEAGGYARSIGFPKGQGSNQVKWFEKLPGARNPEGILHSASLARPKLKQRGVPRGPLSWWKEVLGSGWTPSAGRRSTLSHRGGPRDPPAGLPAQGQAAGVNSTWLRSQPRHQLPELLPNLFPAWEGGFKKRILKRVLQSTS